MRLLLLALVAMIAGGCASKKSGVSHRDAFDDVEVAQMVGNKVRFYVPVQRTVVCLNARRETRRVSMVTNYLAQWVTNASVNAVTNRMILMSTNALASTATNLVPLAPANPTVAPESAEAAQAATNGPSGFSVNAPVAAATNFTFSVSKNQSATASPTQSASSEQTVRTLNNQVTTTSNNLSVSLMTNVVVTLETNETISYSTNLQITVLTNATIVPTNQLVHDFFLCTELLAPPDFTLATGESLFLLVDGTRWGFIPTQPGTVCVARKGYVTTHYRVPPEAIVALGSANEARLRIKGVNSVIERTLSGASKNHFRQFLLAHWTPEAMDAIKADHGRSETERSKPDKRKDNPTRAVAPRHSF